VGVTGASAVHGHSLGDILSAGSAWLGLGCVGLRLSVCDSAAARTPSKRARRIASCDDRGIGEPADALEAIELLRRRETAGGLSEVDEGRAEMDWC
jgi:hypothetical protein